MKKRLSACLLSCQGNTLSVTVSSDLNAWCEDDECWKYDNGFYCFMSENITPEVIHPFFRPEVNVLFIDKECSLDMTD